MYKRNSQSWVKHIDFIILDALALLLSFVLSYYLYNHSLRGISGDLYGIFTFILILLDILIAIFFNTMHNVLTRGYYQEFVHTLKQVLLVFAAELLILFIIKMSASYSRMILLDTLLLHLLLGYLTRWGWKKAVLRFRDGNREKKNIILVCQEEDVSLILARSKSTEESGFSSLVLIDRDAVGETISGLPVVSTLANAGQYICREWVDEVFIYAELSLIEKKRKAKEDDDQLSLFEDDLEKPTGSLHSALVPGSVSVLIDQCRQMAMPIHIRIPLGNFEGKSFIEKVNGFHVITMTSNYASPAQLMIKRVMDITGGLFGSLAALLIILAVGPIIKKKSPGPVIYKQERVGRNGKHFTMYKIRSMYMDADERKKEFMHQNRVSDGMMFNLDFDPRIIDNEILPDGTRKTGIGEFIRNHSLDEFPQFWNVLKGDMSIVGTRPPTVDEWERYQLHHRARLAFKPGVTGMWQAYGHHEITDFEKVVQLDTEYIEHWNIGLDIKLILKTIQNMLKRS